MKNLVLEITESTDLSLLKDLADRLGINYFEIEQITEEEEEKDTYTIEDIQQIADRFPENHLWKYQDLVDHFPQDLSIKVEIIHNKLFIMPTPTPEHQIISDELVFQLNLFIRKHKLGRVLAAPMDVKFDEDNTAQPDILFIAISNYEIIKEKNVQGVPDLVVEIWSPGNHKARRISKKELYEKKGVHEFWQVYPKKQEVLVEVLNESGKYVRYAQAAETGSVRSKVLEGFELDVASLFGE